LLTVNVTVYNPGSMKVWVGFATVSVWPSEYVQRYSVHIPVVILLNATLQGAFPLVGVAVKSSITGAGTVLTPI
jgi:hypothetical protein